MTSKTYRYTNLDGRKKALTIHPIYANDYYFVEIWDLERGEICGNGKKHIDEIAKFLANYGVEI